MLSGGPQQSAKNVGLAQSQVTARYVVDVRLSVSRQPLFLRQVKVDELVDSVVADEQDDAACARLRHAMDAILGLQEVDEIERAI
jgi:hypothetical protein